MPRKSDGSKMLPCQACCPARPELGYPKVGISRHVYDVMDWNAEPVVWAWKCDNCGHFKKPRKPSAKMAIDPWTCTKEEAEKLNVLKRAKFEYFNLNGAYGDWKRFGDLIDTAIAEGVVVTGFWLAYGPNGYHHEQLSKLATAKTFKAWNLHYTVGRIHEQIKNGMERLEEKLAERGRTMADLQAIHKAKGTK